MNKRNVIWLILFSLLFVSFLATPHKPAYAQEGCTDAAGGSIPCPATDVPEDNGGGNGNGKKTPNIAPPTATQTITATTTSTHTPTPTLTPTFTATNIPPTNTITFTPTATAIFSNPSTNWIPGVGIGAFILFVIVGIFLPIVQKIRVSQRG